MNLLIADNRVVNLVLDANVAEIVQRPLCVILIDNCEAEQEVEVTLVCPFLLLVESAELKFAVVKEIVGVAPHHTFDGSDLVMHVVASHRINAVYVKTLAQHDYRFVDLIHGLKASFLLGERHVAFDKSALNGIGVVGALF